MPAPLHLTLDASLPEEIATGAGTAIFICGWCYSPNGAIRGLHLMIDGRRQPVLAHGMPRLDPFLERRHPHAYRSGFWALPRIWPPEGEDRDLVIELVADLVGGDTASAEIGRVRVRRSPPAPEPTGPVAAAVSAAASAGGGASPLVAIAMATYEPPGDLLEVQLASIRAQTHPSWICCISDDGSSAESFAALRRAVGDDPRFVISRSPRRLGFLRNFERALTMVPPEARYVALADQDDRWYPEKLGTLLAAIGDAQLVYSDARVVARGGTSVADSYWAARTNNHTDLLSLLVANSVTGAASLFRAGLLADALPFPPAQFAHYHDHWLGLVALCLGEIAYVDSPLYNYVQHGDASLGHAAANQTTGLIQRARIVRERSQRDRVRLWRMHYFVDYMRLLQVATALEMRCGDRMAPAKRQVLRQFLRAERDPVELVRLWMRGVREVTGARRETLGGEWILFRAISWRHLLSLTARRLPQQRLRLDALPPTDLAPRPPKPGAAVAGPAHAIADKIRPLDLDVREGAPDRINLLIPTIDLDHFFGGYIGKFNLAMALAARGRRVRVVTVDPTGPLPRDWRERLEGFSGLEGLRNHVEIAFGRARAGLEVSPRDTFIATTWWTAHVADAAVGRLRGEGFLYLIQEYEPFTFPMGSYAALARQSYDLPHRALFSTELLRGYFCAHRIGVYAAGPKAGDAAGASFENAITPVPTPTAEQLRRDGPRRLLFYARPEPHAARNLFELGVLALERAAREGCFRDGWVLRGIGSVGVAKQLALGQDLQLELLPRVAQRDYAALLAEHDVGLALMYTPHPSLVPLEMASAGLLTVTNSFENKTPEALAAISSNLICAEPTVGSLAAALAEASAAADDVGRRVDGSVVRWPQSWAEAFSPKVLDFVERSLAAD
ncbi:MAG: glycosyltransferase [Solirubrobacteraceae bacterium]